MSNDSSTHSISWGLHAVFSYRDVALETSVNLLVVEVTCMCVHACALMCVCVHVCITGHRSLWAHKSMSSHVSDIKRWPGDGDGEGY